MQPPKNFMIPKETLEKVASYLALRPYNEVAVLLSELSQCRGIVDQEAAAAAPVDLPVAIGDEKE